MIGELLIVLLLVGCDAPPGKSVSDSGSGAEVSPAVAATCRAEAERDAALGITRTETACVEMLPAQTWSGIWNNGWEWSSFCPAPAETCPIAAEKGDIWLEFAPDAFTGSAVADGIYRIEFVGRRSKVAGGFGHLNQYDHLMKADRVTSIERLPEDRQKN